MPMKYFWGLKNVLFKTKQANRNIQIYFTSIKYELLCCHLLQGLFLDVNSHFSHGKPLQSLNANSEQDHVFAVFFFSKHCLTQHCSSLSQLWDNKQGGGECCLIRASPSIVFTAVKTNVCVSESQLWWVLLLQDGLPLSQSFSYGEASNHAVDLGPPFTHVVLDVEDKWLLAKVSIYDLTRGLKPHSGVQIGLEEIKDEITRSKPQDK